MKKLEDIPKKQVFEAPDGYFDSLPQVVQSRVAQKQGSAAWRSWRPVLRYALPALAVTIGLVWYLNAGFIESPEQLLASIESADIEAYLGDSDMTTEDLLDHIDFNQVQADSLEFENPMLDLGNTDLDDLLNDIDTEL